MVMTAPHEGLPTYLLKEDQISRSSDKSPIEMCFYFYKIFISGKFEFENVSFSRKFDFERFPFQEDWI